MSDHAPYERPHPVVEKVSKMLLKLWGWRVEGKVPDVPKMMVINAPHTAKRETILALVASYSLGRKLYTLGASVAFRRPYRWFFEKTGTIIIPYKQRANVVQRMVEEFNRRNDFILVIAPEGNLYRAEGWKSGFYYIALGANIPVVPIGLDFGTKALFIGEPVYLTGDKEADLERIRPFYDQIKPKYPQYASPIRFIESGSSSTPPTGA